MNRFKPLSKKQETEQAIDQIMRDLDKIDHPPHKSAIKTFGFWTWLRCSWHWKKLATYQDIDGWKRGN